MNKLKCEKLTVFKTTERSVVQFIEDITGHNIDSIVACEELGNQEWNVVVSVRKESSMTSYDDLDYDKFLTTGDAQFRVKLILDKLCEAGHLEAGNYTIDCTW